MFSERRACAALGQHCSRGRGASPADIIELLGNAAAMAIARSQNCCARQTGQSATSGSSVSRHKRGTGSFELIELFRMPSTLSIRF
jgi:hypothetical protein